jgi:hypothetical protein
MTLLLGLAAVISYVAVLFASHKARTSISSVAPDYARRLYNSAGDQIILNLRPFRWDTLFFKPAPSSVRSAIIKLRYLYAAHYAFLFGFLGNIAYGFVSSSGGG